MNNNENRFYVYVHRLVNTGEVFYVGKGTKYRLNSRHGRSVSWNKITSENEWYAEIYTNNLTDTQAKKLEIDLIQLFNPVTNFHVTDISAREVKFQDFIGLYYYCEKSPSGLRYLRGNNQGGKKKRVAGDVAGTLLPSGYYTVRCNDSNYFAHRVVWCLVNQCNIQKELIDHIDRNRSNNCISNLRLATHSENNKNCSTKSHNKTGYNGVSYLANFNLYVATWVDIDGKQETKSFSSIKYGRDLALGLCVEYRHKMTSNKNGYPENTEYVRHVSLEKYSEGEIQEMFDCDLVSSNKSGVRNVWFHSVKNNSFWTYGGEHNDNSKRFSCTKYGYDLARELALEYKSYVENGISMSNISEKLKVEIENPTRSNNQTGFRNLSFIGENRDIILVQVMINYKNNSKRFDTRKMGLLPAIAAALQWRDEMKNKNNGGYFGAI